MVVDMIRCPGCGVKMDLSTFPVRPDQVICPCCNTRSIVPPLVPGNHYDVPVTQTSPSSMAPSQFQGQEYFSPHIQPSAVSVPSVQQPFQIPQTAQPAMDMRSMPLAQPVNQASPLQPSYYGVQSPALQTPVVQPGNQSVSVQSAIPIQNAQSFGRVQSAGFVPSATPVSTPVQPAQPTNTFPVQEAVQVNPITANQPQVQSVLQDQKMPQGAVSVASVPSTSLQPQNQYGGQAQPFNTTAGQFQASSPSQSAQMLFSSSKSAETPSVPQQTIPSYQAAQNQVASQLSAAPNAPYSQEALVSATTPSAPSSAATLTSQGNQSAYRQAATSSAQGTSDREMLYQQTLSRPSSFSSAREASSSVSSEGTFGSSTAASLGSSNSLTGARAINTPQAQNVSATQLQASTPSSSLKAAPIPVSKPSSPASGYNESVSARGDSRKEEKVNEGSSRLISVETPKEDKIQSSFFDKPITEEDASKPEVLPIDKKGNMEPLAFSIMGLASIIFLFPPLGLALCIASLLMSADEKGRGLYNSHNGASKAIALIGIIANVILLVAEIILLIVVGSNPSILLGFLL